jgi:hypothetical protein
MDLGGTEKGDVVPLGQMLHQLRDELLRWQATETPILRRNDDVKAAKGIGNLPAALKTAEGGAGRRK